MIPTLRAEQVLNPPTEVSGESTGPLAQIARLAALRDEASETASLANLLGRTPLVIATLAPSAGVLVAAGQTGLASRLTWVLLLGVGLFALARVYRHSLASPFELAWLGKFTGNLRAVLLYVGFAWGAGSFLALPSQASLVEMVAFSAGVSGVLAGILRRSGTLASFGLPAALLTAAASIRGASIAGLSAGAAIFVLGLAPIAACYLFERLGAHLSGPNFGAIQSN